MKVRIILFVYATIGSITTWIAINFYLVEIPFWKYIIIELLIVLTKMIYEKEKKRLTGK